jgi:hypothetical protein
MFFNPLGIVDGHHAQFSKQSMFVRDLERSTSVNANIEKVRIYSSELKDTRNHNIRSARCVVAAATVAGSLNASSPYKDLTCTAQQFLCCGSAAIQMAIEKGIGLRIEFCLNGGLFDEVEDYVTFHNDIKYAIIEDAFCNNGLIVTCNSEELSANVSFDINDITMNLLSFKSNLILFCRPLSRTCSFFCQNAILKCCPKFWLQRLILVIY